MISMKAPSDTGETYKKGSYGIVLKYSMNNSIRHLVDPVIIFTTEVVGEISEKERAQKSVWCSERQEKKAQILDYCRF